MVQAPIEPQLFYPDSDGKPMADNTVQYRWIVRLVANLRYLFKEQTVFVAGDLLWYPQQVTVPPAPRQAPDAMVVFGRPPGERGSYKQWEEDNIAPQVVFEILSPSNSARVHFLSVGILPAGGGRSIIRICISSGLVSSVSGGGGSIPVLG